MRALTVTAEMRGAKVEFILPQLNPTQFDGLPAFSAPLPSELLQIQRREYFRISAPLAPVLLSRHGRAAAERVSVYRICR